MQAHLWRFRELVLYTFAAFLGILALSILRGWLITTDAAIAHWLSFEALFLLVQYIALAIPLGILLWYRKKNGDPMMVPLHWRGWMKTLLLPCTALAVFVLVLFLLSHIPFDLPGLNGTGASLSALLQDTVATILLITMAVVVAPLVEESIFRGFLQPALLQWVRPLGAILIQAFFFASLHQQGGVVLVLFLFGVFTGWLAWKEDSILPSIVFHALNNAITVYFDYTTAGS